MFIIKLFVRTIMYVYLCIYISLCVSVEREREKKKTVTQKRKTNPTMEPKCPLLWRFWHINWMNTSMKGLVGSRYSTVISNLERIVAFAEDAGLTSHWFIHHFKGLYIFFGRSSQESPQYSQQPSQIGIWEASSVVLITTTTTNNNSSNKNKNKNNNNNRTYWEQLHQALGRLR